MEREANLSALEKVKLFKDDRARLLSDVYEKISEIEEFYNKLDSNYHHCFDSCIKAPFSGAFRSKEQYHYLDQFNKNDKTTWYDRFEIDQSFFRWMFGGSFNKLKVLYDSPKWFRDNEYSAKTNSIEKFTFKSLSSLDKHLKGILECINKRDIQHYDV